MPKLTITSTFDSSVVINDPGIASMTIPPKETKSVELTDAQLLLLRPTLDKLTGLKWLIFTVSDLPREPAPLGPIHTTVSNPHQVTVDVVKPIPAESRPGVDVLEHDTKVTPHTNAEGVVVQQPTQVTPNTNAEGMVVEQPVQMESRTTAEGVVVDAPVSSTKFSRNRMK